MLDARDGAQPLLGVGGEGGPCELVLLGGDVLDADLGGGQDVEPGVDLRGDGGGEAEYGHEAAHAEDGAEGGEHGPAGAAQHPGDGLGKGVAHGQPGGCDGAQGSSRPSRMVTVRAPRRATSGS